MTIIKNLNQITIKLPWKLLYGTRTLMIVSTSLFYNQLTWSLSPNLRAVPLETDETQHPWYSLSVLWISYSWGSPIYRKNCFNSLTSHMMRKKGITNFISPTSGVLDDCQVHPRRHVLDLALLLPLNWPSFNTKHHHDTAALRVKKTSHWCELTTDRIIWLHYLPEHIGRSGRKTAKPCYNSLPSVMDY